LKHPLLTADVAGSLGVALGFVVLVAALLFLLALLEPAKTNALRGPKSSGQHRGESGATAPTRATLGQNVGAEPSHKASTHP